MLLQLLVASQVPGIQAGVFASGPELIARDVYTSGPIFRDFVLPGRKTTQGSGTGWTRGRPWEDPGYVLHTGSPSPATQRGKGGPERDTCFPKPLTISPPTLQAPLV